MDEGERFKRSSSYTSPEFRQKFQEMAPNRDTRQLLVEQGILRPKTGDKRKHVGGDEGPSHQQHGPNQYASNLFKRSTYTVSPTPQPEEHFKPPQPRQRAKLDASRRQGSLEDDDLLQELTGKKRKPIESSLATGTPHPNLAVPESPGRDVGSPGIFRLGNTLGALKSRASQPSSQRFSSSPRPMPTPQFRLPRSQLSPALRSEQRSIQPPMNSRASSVQTVSLKPVKKRPDIAPGTTRQQINANGSKFTTTDETKVPSIDRRLKDPPPDIESLNRLLQQVPGILTKLSNQQEQVIRDLATKVNTHEERIELLETHNADLQELVSAKSKSFTEEMDTRFAAMEKRMDDQAQQIADLQAENEQLQQHIDGTRTGIQVTDNQAQSVNNLTPLSDQTTSSHDHGQSNGHEPISSFDEKYIYSDHQQRSQEPTSPFDEDYIYDYGRRESNSPTATLHAPSQRHGQEPFFAFENANHENSRDPLDMSNGSDEYDNQAALNMIDGLDHRDIQDSLNSLNRGSSPGVIVDLDHTNELSNQQPVAASNGLDGMDAGGEAT